MPRRPKRSLSSLLLAASNFGTFFFPFLRGTFLARLLSPENFGLAISITTIASIIDLISDVGLNQFAVKVSDPTAISTLQSIALIRSALLAIVLAVSGPLFALLFNAPGTAWVYSLVALAFFIRGFSHLGVKTAMRGFNFALEATTELVGHATWTVVSIGAALVFHDYRAMVLGLIAYAVSGVVTSHVLSRTPWRLGWDSAVARGSARFGRLLIPNGAATVLVNMGDRTVVGSFLGLDALAYYSVLSTSAFLPRSAVVRFLNALMTPQFVHASTQKDSDRLLVMSAIILSFIGSFFAFGYMALGQPVIMLVFGRHYAVGQQIVSLVALLSCIRFMAAIPTPVGVAKGDTGLILLNTTTSAGGLALGLAFVLRGVTLESMVSGLCVGELVALLYVVRKLLRSHPASARSLWSALIPSLAIVFACATVIAYAGFATSVGKIGVGVAATVVEVVLLAGVMRSNAITVRNMAGVFLPKHNHPPA